MRRAPARPLCACFVRTCCAVVVQDHDLRATTLQCNAKRTLSSHFALHSSHAALHTSHLHLTLRTLSQLISALLHVRKLETQMHLHRRIFTKYFVPQSLHKARPSTTLYYNACTEHFPALLCTKKLAHSTSQYYFVLQSLRKILPSTTLNYKACTKHAPALLCTTKLAQGTSLVLQTFHRQLRPLHTEKHQVSCSGFLPTTNPM